MDCQFILLTFIQKFKSTRNLLYSCFIDFSKAFDSLDHSLLWSKLANFGLSSHILSLLQDMYSKANSCVRVNGNTSQFFSCNKGVRQGCNLSPLLFCLFISDLESSLLNNGVLGVKLVNLCLPLLLFADDVLLFGNSPEDLQHFLNILSSYCATWNLTVNLSKTKVMVFYTKNLSHLSFCYLGSPIEIKSEYKYLGIVFTSNGLFNFSKATLSLAGQANKALFSLLKKAQSLNFPNPDVMSHSFDSMLLPILE